MQPKFYNSLSKKLEDFKPLRAGKAGIYSCGPTVYDHVHIGNLRTYIFEDTLKRVLKAAGYDITHVMNITDVDDKTIKRSHQDFPDDDPKAALAKLTGRYEKLFLKDTAKVGIDLSNSKIAKATEYIGDMQTLIRQIPTKYVEPDGVYFDINKYQDYGVLVKLDRAHSHHRINNDEYDKEHVADFALWKVKRPGEPAWEFEIDGQKLDGRPGWHIECSAMSTQYLGQPFDIHTGGTDLMFPHHENEIAQSRAAANKPLANCFIHAQHLVVNGRKMSKSLKNFYVLDDIVDKNYDPIAFRLLVLQAHYRHQLNFTWEALDAAQTFLERLRSWADLQFQPSLGHKKTADEAYAPALEKINQALADDLNTGQALAEVSSLASDAEAMGVNIEKLQPFLAVLDELLGLELSNRRDIEPHLKDLMAKREEARKASDWGKADELREQLLGDGIEINDTLHGPVWSRAKN